MTDEQGKSSNDKPDGEVKNDSDEEKGDDTEICPCGEDIPDETKLVCCDNCHQWWHGACANLKGITEEGIAELKEWKCPHCYVSPHVSVEVLKSTFPLLFGKDIEKPIEAVVKAEVRKVIPKIIKSVVQETMKEKNFTKTFADVVKQRQEEFSAQASKTIEKSMNSAIQNNQQRILDKANVKQDADNIAREKRKRSVVFSSVPESKLKSAEGRYQSDFKKVERMIAPQEDDLIVSCHRAGKKVGDKPRLLIVTMATPELAQILHCYGSGRKFVYGDGAEIWCNPDLIKADRIANFNARKLQRERREKINEKKEGDGQPKMRTATVSNKPSTAAKSGVIDEFSDSDVHSQSESESVPPGNIHGSF